MLKSLYEFEKCNKSIYDSVHEYCLAEKMNEEQLRVSINKREWVKKPTRMYKFIGNLLILHKGNY